MDFKNEKLVILFGSQTGNAQDVAERIRQESKKFYFVSYVKPMDEYNILELVHEKCVIFVCSTTGQGEEPDNMKKFWKFLLRKSLSANSLANVNFAVMGLGDSSYVKYNFAAKRLNKRLQQLGGNDLVPLGLGDDQHDLGYDAAVDPWLTRLWEKLLHVFPLPDGVNPQLNYDVLSPKWTVSTSCQLFKTNELVKTSKSLKTNALSKLHGESKVERSIYYASRNAQEFTVTVLDNKRTTDPNHFQDVRLIKLKAEGQTYKPGDLVVLRPQNSSETINEFQEVLKTNGVNIDLKEIFHISQKTPEISVPPALLHDVTFEELCAEYFDLAAIPRRSVFRTLAQITDSALEKEKCIEFTMPEGQQDLYNYINRPRRNITEVLQDFPHATKNLTPELLFEILPSMKPREFSIASSSKYHSNEIHILVAVVRYKTKLVKERLGLCSNYLADLKPNQTVSAWFKTGSFKFPPEAKDAPIIMVGPGTGLAPFRNYIFERCKDGTATSDNLILFFGCRGKNLDFHCKEELQGLHEDKKLNLICAFSRDQEDKVYVQHKILQNKELMWEALKKKGYVFVAGNSKNMPQQVRDAFVDICEECGGMTRDDAEIFVKSMELSDQYQTETWS